MSHIIFRLSGFWIKIGSKNCLFICVTVMYQYNENKKQLPMFAICLLLKTIFYFMWIYGNVWSSDVVTTKL